MKVTICLLVAALAVVMVAAGRPSFGIDHLDWVARTSTGFPLASIASSKDLLAYYDTSAEDSVIAIRRRNNEGGYDLVANITQGANPYVRAANGKWVWVMPSYMFMIDENNKITDTGVIDTNGGSMLSDDTFVAFQQGEIRTFKYSAATNWTVIAGTELTGIDFPLYSNYDYQSYRAYDNVLLIAAPAPYNNISLYQRQQDKSWSFSEAIAIPDLNTASFGVIYNGVDTVVLSVDKSLSDASNGVVYIYTKKNGAWNKQTFNTTNVGYIPSGYIGASCAFIDADTLLIAAPGATFFNRAPFQIGKVLMMKRTNGGDWAPYLDIVGNGADIFAMSIALNDYDLVVIELSLTPPNSNRLRVFTAPLCFAQPMNVTCSNTQLNDCSSLANTQLYTVNSSPRCGAVTPFLNGISLVDQKVQAGFTFTRFDALESYLCNATVTCPSPVVPVAIKAPTAKTSGGSMMIQFSLAALSVYFAFF